MGFLEVSHLHYAIPGGRELLRDVGFRVGDGEHVALVGINGAGKTTLLRLLAGDETGANGTITIDGRLAFMRQFIGSVRDRTTVRDLLVGLSPPAIRLGAERLHDAEDANDRLRSNASGIGYAEALTQWADVGGYTAEVLWDVCTTAALRQPFGAVAARAVSTLSGGEQKRLALELLFRSDDEVLLLDEPDNYLDLRGKERLEESLNGCKKTILFVSHDRALLAATAHKIVALEARGAWTHGGSFATWRQAREDRLARLDEEHRRWREEQSRIQDQIRELRRQLTMSDAAASRLRATKTKMKRHEEAVPPERPKDQNIVIKLAGDRTGKRAITIEGLAIAGLIQPFSTEIIFGERVAVLGANGTGKSHFLRLLAGEPVAHEGKFQLGARVVPGYFSQTHDQPLLANVPLVELLLARALTRGQAMAALRRYELHESATQPFETLSGGQQARVQILLLELGGATLLLLDEPTDNLDLASAEALEDALGTFQGTVVAVTHDRWFMGAFDRYLVFHREGAVSDEIEPQYD